MVQSDWLRSFQPKIGKYNYCTICFRRKLRETGTTDRRKESDRPRSVRTDSSIIAVDELVLSQEDAPQTHHAKSAERPVSLKLVMRNRPAVEVRYPKSWDSGWLKRGPSAMPQRVIDEARPSTGVNAFVVVYLPKADTSNTSYDT